MKAIILSLVIISLMIGASVFPMKKQQSVYASNDKKNISEGIIVVNFAVPKEGINVIYTYKDHTSGIRGTELANLTADSPQMNWLGSSSEVDSGYSPGDKVTVSVSKYVTDRGPPRFVHDL